MLIKHLKYLYSALFAIYFVFAGIGYNVVQFCCDDCANQGIDFIAQHSCAAVHHDKNHDCCDLSCEKLHETNHLAHLQTCSHDNSCQIIRVQLHDFSVVEDIINTTISSSDLFVDVNTENDISGHLIYSLLLNEYSPPPNLLILSGREILSNKSVLII